MIIALEGIDGSGKHTQATLLRSRLERSGFSTVLFSFPRYGQTFFANSITDYLAGRFGSLSSVDPHLAALFYAGDRFETKPSIIAAMSDYDVVLCDRYVASNLAHQGARMPTSSCFQFIQWVATLEHEVYGLPRAQLTLYFDTSSEAASVLIRSRAQGSSTSAAADIHESDTAYLERCREVYRMLADQNFLSDWQTISCLDASGHVRDPSTIASAVWDISYPAIAQSCHLRQPI